MGGPSLRHSWNEQNQVFAYLPGPNAWEVDDLLDEPNFGRNGNGKLVSSGYPSATLKESSISHILYIRNDGS